MCPSYKYTRLALTKKYWNNYLPILGTGFCFHRSQTLCFWLITHLASFVSFEMTQFSHSSVSSHFPSMCSLVEVNSSFQTLFYYLCVCLFNFWFVHLLISFLAAEFVPTIQNFWWRSASIFSLPLWPAFSWTWRSIRSATWVFLGNWILGFFWQPRLLKKTKTLRRYWTLY